MSHGVALIGAGYISYLHVLGARATPGLAVKAVASRSRAAAEHRGRIFDADAYTLESLEEMLTRDDVDIAIVAGPNSLHFEHAMAAIRQGKHVVIEKPMVLTLAEANALARAAAARGVGIGYAENLVFAPIVERAREVVTSGVLGRITRATCDFKHGGPSTTGWFRSATLAGGGAHIDLGCHALEVLLFLLGHPNIVRVVESTMRIDPVSGLDLDARCIHECEDGTLVETDASWAEPQGKVRAVLEGERGKLTLALSTGELVLERAGAAPQALDFPWARDFTIAGGVMRQGYGGQLAHFAQAFAAGTPPREGVVEGTNVLRLLLAAYVAAGSGRPANVANAPADVSPIAGYAAQLGKS
jgi:predicted dehydrogenase